MPPTALPRRSPPSLLPRLLLVLSFLAWVVPAARAAAPVAADDYVRDLAPATTRLIDVTANDSHPDGLAFRVVDLTAPRDENGAPVGLLTLHDDGSLSFSLGAADPQQVSFHYALEDSTGTRSATAYVCIGDCLSVIFAPSSDLFTAEVGVPATLDVLANDQGESLAVIGWSQPEPAHGADLDWNAAAQTFTYTAATLGDGEDHFTYTVEDAQGSESTVAVAVTLSAGGTSSAHAVLDLDHCDGTPGPPKCYFRADGSTGRVGPAELDWGDGSPVTQVSNLNWFWHAYPPGTADYLVSLTIYDAQGLPDVDSLWVHATDAAPTLGGPFYYDCTADLRCTLSAIPSSDVVGWSWDFGSSLPPTTQPAPITRVFPAPGSYPVTVTVSDGAQQTASGSVVVEVPEVAPVILDVTPNCFPNLYCTFTPVMEDPLAVATYNWEFGDGGFGNGPTGAHPYDAYGRYTVTLTVEGRGVTEDTFSREIWIGEDHRVEIGSGAATVGAVEQVALGNRFDSPVVIIQPLAYGGSSPLVARMTQIAPDHFSFVLEAAGTPPTGGVSYDYLVVDEGIWQLSDGSVIEAWRLPRAMPYEWPGDLDLAEVGLLKSDLWFRAPFLHFFAEPPVVLTQVQTRQEASFTNTRQRRTTDRWVDLALEEAEGDATPHALETVALVAVTPGRRTVDGFRDVDFPDVGFRLDAKRTQGIDDAWTTVTLGGPFSVPPKVFAGVATHADADSVTLRRANLTANSVDFRLHEDRTHDNEIDHAKEKTALLAVSEAGLLLTTPLAASSQAPPVAGPDRGETTVGLPITVLALLNDGDPDGEPVSIDQATQPVNGWVEIALYPLNRGIGLTWYPPPGFTGSDSFTYRLRDSAGFTSPPQTVTLVAVAAGPGVLLERDFEIKADLNGWVTRSGNASIEKGELRFVAGDGGLGGEVLWQGGGGWTGHRAEIDLRCESTPERTAIGVVLRYLDDDNQLRLTWHVAEEQWVVEQVSEGVVTSLGTAPDILAPELAWTLSVEIDGTTLRWSTRPAGQQALVAPTVHEVTVGGIGQGTLGVTGDGCGRFDNLKVTDLETIP